MYLFMAQDQKQLYMPGQFGGLMRYNEDSHSKFMFSPKAVVAFLVAVIAFIIALKVFWPIG